MEATHQPVFHVTWLEGHREPWKYCVLVILTLGILGHVRKVYKVTALRELSVIPQQAATPKRDKGSVLKCGLNSRYSQEFGEGKMDELE